MTTYSAIMLDETFSEFSVEVKAKSRAKAYDQLREMYPESRVVKLQSPAEQAAEMKRIEQFAQMSYERGY